MISEHKFIHFNTYDSFLNCYLATDESNTLFQKADGTGVPAPLEDGCVGFKYDSFIVIKDRKQIWTHGQLTDDLNKVLSNYVSTEDYTAEDILNKLKMVDGSGSGLDADTLDGNQPSSLNVNSAKTLTTTRTLWGQSFNGSQNVSGDMSNVRDIHFQNNSYIGSGINPNLRPTYIYCKNHIYSSVSSYNDINSTNDGVQYALLHADGQLMLKRYNIASGTAEEGNIVGYNPCINFYTKAKDNSGNYVPYTWQMEPNYNNQHQFKISTNDPQGYFNFTRTITINENKVWHEGNDGSGSGLDADKLDGQEGSWYQSNVYRFATLKNASGSSPTEEGAVCPDANVDGNMGGLLSNYSNPSLWQNAPNGMGYGRILTISGNGNQSLAGQLAWDVWHNNEKPTGKLWWRAGNSTGWGNDWKQIAFTENVLSKDVFRNNIEIRKGNTGGTTITTQEFIEKLKTLGAFNYPHWEAKCSWKYANNDTINDTGCGFICLAGSIIEVWNINSTDNYTIRIITAPTAPSNPGGTPNAVFIYRNQGTTYNPGWKRLANIDDSVAGLTWTSHSTFDTNSILGSGGGKIYVGGGGSVWSNLPSTTGNAHAKTILNIPVSTSTGQLFFNSTGNVHYRVGNNTNIREWKEFVLMDSSKIVKANGFQVDGQPGFLKSDGSIDTNDYLEIIKRIMPIEIGITHNGNLVPNLSDVISQGTSTQFGIIFRNQNYKNILQERFINGEYPNIILKSTEEYLIPIEQYYHNNDIFLDVFNKSNGKFYSSIISLDYNLFQTIDNPIT